MSWKIRITNFIKYRLVKVTYNEAIILGNFFYKYKALGNYNQDDYASAIFDRNSNLIEKSISRNSIFIKLED